MFILDSYSWAVIFCIITMLCWVSWANTQKLLGMTFNIIASGQAGFAISYGLGQGATLIAALWGVCIWKEFRNVKNISLLLTLMFVCYIAGLVLIIASRNL